MQISFLRGMAYHRLAAVAALLILPGCAERSMDDHPAARVGDAIITQGELAARYGLSADESPQSNLQGDFIFSGLTTSWEEAARDWAEEEILIQEAKRRGLDQDSLFEARLESLRRKILIAQLYSQVTSSVQVDSPEVLAEYNAQRSEYVTTSDQIDLLYVIAPNRDLANQVRRALQGDSSITEVLSLDDLLMGEAVGWVNDDELDRALAKAAFSLAPGGISYPLKHDRGGYIILQCRKRRPAGTVLPLEEVYEKIHGRVLLHKQLKAEKAFRDSLWAVYNPVIFTRAEKKIKSGNK